MKGTATIAAFPKYKSGYLQPIFQDPHRQVVDISGKVDVEIPVARDLQLLDDYRQEIVFDVVVEEELTGRRQNNTATTTLYKYPYKLELVKTADAWKPGMPYTCYLKLSYQAELRTNLREDFTITVKVIRDGQLVGIDS